LLGTRCRSPNSGLSPDKHDGAEAAPKGDAVRQCLRRLAKKLQRAAGADDEKPGVRWERRRKSRSKTKPDTEDRRGARVVDGTTREREEAVAGAIAYCKETSSRRRSGTSPPPPSPSLDCWLMDRPEEEIGTACAAARCKCPGLRRDVSLLEWLPEAPACTPSAAVPHHCGYASCDGMFLQLSFDTAACMGVCVKSWLIFVQIQNAAETPKRTSRHGPAGELGIREILDELDIEVLGITNYFAAKY
jgi:hypothetical protein